MPPPKIVVHVEGGVVQQIFLDDPSQQVLLVDWDVDLEDYNHPDVFTLGEDSGPRDRAYVVEFAPYALDELAGTQVAAAIQAFDLSERPCAAMHPAGS